MQFHLFESSGTEQSTQSIHSLTYEFPPEFASDAYCSHSHKLNRNSSSSNTFQNKRLLRKISISRFQMIAERKDFAFFIRSSFELKQRIHRTLFIDFSEVLVKDSINL